MHLLKATSVRPAAHARENPRVPTVAYGWVLQPYGNSNPPPPTFSSAPFSKCLAFCSFYKSIFFLKALAYAGYSTHSPLSLATQIIIMLANFFLLATVENFSIQQNGRICAIQLNWIFSKYLHSQVCLFIQVFIISPSLLLGPVCP